MHHFDKWPLPALRLDPPVGAVDMQLCGPAPLQDLHARLSDACCLSPRHAMCARGAAQLTARSPAVPQSRSDGRPLQEIHGRHSADATPSYCPVSSEIKQIREITRVLNMKYNSARPSLLGSD